MKVLVTLVSAVCFAAPVVLLLNPPPSHNVTTTPDHNVTTIPEGPVRRKLPVLIEPRSEPRRFLAYAQANADFLYNKIIELQRQIDLLSGESGGSE
jgi:hypothetical protein